MLFPKVCFESGGLQSQQAIVENDPRKPINAGETEDFSFQQLFESSTRELKPSTKLLSLDGKRVRMVGFMAQMETQPENAFYLCPRPVFVDESGAGTGELPIGSVRVILSMGKNQKITHISQTIEVTGILEAGNRLEAYGNGDRYESWLTKPLPIRDSLLPTDLSGEFTGKGYTPEPIDRAEKNSGCRRPLSCFTDPGRAPGSRSVEVDSIVLGQAEGFPANGFDSAAVYDQEHDTALILSNVNISRRRMEC
jgi:hypothetical protein